MQFKWRNHDPQIGRFIEIDPLAEKYVYNSTYAFSENKVTNHVELEGLESVEAAIANEWRSWGITDNKQAVKPVMAGAAKAALDPMTYAEAFGTAGQIAAPFLLTSVMTGGLGGGLVVQAEAEL